MNETEKQQQYQAYFRDVLPAAIKSIFPNVSKSFVEANPQLFASQLKQDIRPAVVDPAPREAKSDARPIVGIVMYRVRLLDKDNAFGAAKPLTDCLCKVGLIPGDAEDQIDLHVTQQKVPHYHEQRTEVSIAYPA